MQFTITSAQILGFCAFITALYGVYKIYAEVKKPSDELKKQVQENTRHLTIDDERLKIIEKTDELILKSLLVIINHDITNNGFDKLKEARDEIQNYLIQK